MGGSSIGGLEDLSPNELEHLAGKLLESLDLNKLDRTRTVEITRIQRKRWVLFGQLIPRKRDQMVRVISRAEFYLTMDGRLLRFRDYTLLSDTSEEVRLHELDDWELQELVDVLIMLRR